MVGWPKMMVADPVASPLGFGSTDGLELCLVVFRERKLILRCSSGTQNRARREE
jgi:hypothetical protein